MIWSGICFPRASSGCNWNVRPLQTLYIYGLRPLINEVCRFVRVCVCIMFSAGSTSVLSCWGESCSRWGVPSFPVLFPAGFSWPAFHLRFQIYPLCLCYKFTVAGNVSVWAQGLCGHMIGCCDLYNFWKVTNPVSSPLTSSFPDLFISQRGGTQNTILLVTKLHWNLLTSIVFSKYHLLCCTEERLA